MNRFIFDEEYLLEIINNYFEPTSTINLREIDWRIQWLLTHNIFLGY